MPFAEPFSKPSVKPIPAHRGGENDDGGEDDGGGGDEKREES